MGGLRPVRCAAIDVGSNSVLLVALEVRPGGSARLLADEERITRLGQGLAPGGRLDPDRRAATRAAVASFARRCRELGIDRAWGVATSAVRRAADGLSFAEEITRATGVPVEIVAGEREARLVYRAVASGLGKGARGLLVADVGGGSTELVLAGDGGEVVSLASVPVGAVGLTERCLPLDPPAADDLGRLRAAAAKAVDVEPVVGAQGTGAVLAASGGTATTLAALDLELDPYDPTEVHGHVLARERVSVLLSHLATLPLGARRRLPGMHPERAGVIVAGAALLEAVLARAGAVELLVSDRGLRHGLLAEKLAGLGMPLDLGSLGP